MNNAMLELKFKPKGEPDSSEEEQRQVTQSKKIGEEQITSGEYLKKLFVEKHEQTKKVIGRQSEEFKAKLKAVFKDEGQFIHFTTMKQLAEMEINMLTQEEMDPLAEKIKAIFQEIPSTE